jgi:uncharacterized membrane protein HdeD (DUF308 family)
MSNAPPWKVGVIGAVACAAGYALLVVDWTLPQFGAFVAMLFIARGALHIVTTSFPGLPGALSALLALAELAVGLLLLVWPSPTVLVLVVVVGVWAIARAVTVITTNLATRSEHPRWRLILAPSLLELVLGAALFARSSGSVRDVAVIIGAVMILEGVKELGTAVGTMRNESPRGSAVAAS